MMRRPVRLTLRIWGLMALLGAALILPRPDSAAHAESFFLAHAFFAPNPDVYGRAAFGYSLAAVGNNIAIGAVEDDTATIDGGAVYLFDGATGTLLRTFLDPTPEIFEGFGIGMATLGDNVLIGSPQVDIAGTNTGTVYLFDASAGSILRTFTNPTPAGNDGFGARIASLGDDLIVSAWADDTAGEDAGAAYLLDGVSGQLLQTFLNPAPGPPDYAGGDSFGSSLAVLGTNVVISAQLDDAGATNAGSVYLMDPASGDIIQTFSNPSPSFNDQFGTAVATLGDDVIIGAPLDDTGASNTGSAYLFDGTTGALMHTFLNPTPGASDQFGVAMTVVGANVVIGAIQDDTAGTDAGAAYLFSPDGTLLRTFLNPTPVDDHEGGFAVDEFGYPLAAFGDDVLISAPFDDTLATDAGAVYLFEAVPPGDTDGDGCTDKSEVLTVPGSEGSGGRRDPNNPWDYFNPTKDGANRGDDITAVIMNYGQDQGEPGSTYSVNYDRAPLPGANPWQFGPPDGRIRGFEITAIVNSYGHDCRAAP